MTSCVMICKASDQASANEVARALGYGPSNFSVPLSPNGQRPATHYGGNAAGGIGLEFKAIIEAAQQGQFPSLDLPDINLPALFERLDLTFDGDWLTVLTARKLETIHD